MHNSPVNIVLPIRLLRLFSRVLAPKTLPIPSKMTQKIATFAALVVLAAGCSKSNKMERGQQNYQTVQEGSASGVTSTINGPGETAQLTETNVDTTTNFTIPTNPNPLGNSTAGTAFAGALPSTSAYPTGLGTAPARRPIQPRTDTQGMASSSAPVVTDTIGSTTPPMPKETRTAPRSEPEPSTTTSSSEPPATTTTTSTSPESEMDPKAPAPKKKANDSQKSEDPQQPPPPPPPTDTFGPRG
jgi:hypothetical protein